MFSVQPKLCIHLSVCFNVLMMMLEFLEVLNLYNCKRWLCMSIPLAVLFVTIILNILTEFKDKYLKLSIIVHTLGSSGLTFWAIEYWSIFTRHRTEYYDTHAVYFSIMFTLNAIFYILPHNIYS